MNKAELNAFKDGVADALIEGYQASWHENFVCYKQGFDFGINLFCQMEENE
jgi:hypothetical protein|tara:strand:+ start:391 stop:543 length:153 start_codon:yes stop_codon:yes gene_type:complete